MKIYAIKDTKVGFLAPFVYQNDAVAIREFSNIINFGDNNVSNNYADMQLFCLGSYDLDTGAIVSNVEFIQNGSNLKKAD